MQLNVVILAAGKGLRMASRKPKALHQLAGKPLLHHVLDTASALQSAITCVVAGHGAEELRAAVAGREVSIVIQEPQLGTAHAVRQALDHLDRQAMALILYGDVPLIRAQTLQTLLQPLHQNSLAVLTCEVSDPAGLGRIIRGQDGQISAIVEEQDANEKQKAIAEVNTGIMAAPVEKLRDWLPRIEADNAQQEYYLTDLAELARRDGCELIAHVCQRQWEVAGVNDRSQLAQLERHHQRALAAELMSKGVSLADPSRFDVRGEADIAEDVEIDVNVILDGKVSIEQNVRIGAGCVLRNCHIGEGTRIHPYTLIEDARVGRQCSLGPFARLRPGTELRDAARIGNFVEIKNSRIGAGSKASHLSYIGDSQLGEEVNIGAGAVTCNYDGASKHQTLIGDKVFVGSNAVLVAPVEIADGAYIGAGSSITKPVEKNQLAIARDRQTNIGNWRRPGQRQGRPQSQRKGEWKDEEGKE